MSHKDPSVVRTLLHSDKRPSSESSRETPATETSDEDMADYLSALAAVCETAPRMNVPQAQAMNAAVTPAAAPRLNHFAEAPSYHPVGHPHPPRPPPFAERTQQQTAIIQTSSLCARTNSVNLIPAPTVYETPLQQQQDASYLQYLTIPTYGPSQPTPGVSPESPLGGCLAGRYRQTATISLTPYHAGPAASTHIGYPQRGLGGDYLRRPRTPSEFLLPPLPPPPPLYSSSFPLTPPPTPKSPPAAIPSSREGGTPPQVSCNDNPVAVSPAAHAKFERFLDETWPTEPLRRGTAVIRAELYAKIADALRGSAGETAAATARFRQWVKRSEFFLVERTQPDGSYGACLAVPAERRGRRTPPGEGEEEPLAKRASRQSSRLVARVEDFVYIIGAYHNDTSGHHGIRKTYAMVSIIIRQLKISLALCIHV